MKKDNNNNNTCKKIFKVQNYTNRLTNERTNELTNKPTILRHTTIKTNKFSFFVILFFFCYFAFVNNNNNKRHSGNKQHNDLLFFIRKKQKEKKLIGRAKKKIEWRYEKIRTKKNTTLKHSERRIQARMRLSWDRHFATTLSYIHSTEPNQCIMLCAPPPLLSALSSSSA